MLTNNISKKYGGIIGILFFLSVFSPKLFFHQYSGDDASYISHAFTLGLDGDLNYSNEITTQLSANKLYPSHPIGSGILAAPFVFIFSIIDRITDHPIINNHHNYQGSYSLFGYVFAVNLLFFIGIYYYLRAFKLLQLINNNLNWIICMIFSTTIIHYVLKRYFMSHGFEFFSVALLFWCIVTIYTKAKRDKNLGWYYLLFGFLFSLNLFVRYSNINLILLAPITFLILHLYLDKQNEPTNRKQVFKHFYLLPIVSMIATLPNLVYINYYYGSYLPKLSLIYNKPLILESYSLLEIVITLLKRIPYIFNIIFSSEMGLLYTNPILPIGFISIFILLFAKKNKKHIPVLYNILLTGLLLLFVGFSVSLHLWWQELAGSYGYRYLLQILPLALLGVLIFDNYLKKYPLKYSIFYKRFILFFSTISIISMFFFQANNRLELDRKINTFNVLKSYSANGYMINLPVEIIKPYTWMRLAGKSTLFFLISPVIIQYDHLDDILFKYIKPINGNVVQIKEDFKKYNLRYKEGYNLNSILQICILLFLWFIASKKIFTYGK